MNLEGTSKQNMRIVNNQTMINMQHFLAGKKHINIKYNI
jgi:hypothetical protein